MHYVYYDKRITIAWLLCANCSLHTVSSEHKDWRKNWHILLAELCKIWGGSTQFLIVHTSPKQKKKVDLECKEIVKSGIKTHLLPFYYTPSLHSFITVLFFLLFFIKCKSLFILIPRLHVCDTLLRFAWIMIAHNMYIYLLTNKRADMKRVLPLLLN